MQVFSKPKFQERMKEVQPMRIKRKKYVTAAGTGSDKAISESIVVDFKRSAQTTDVCVGWIIDTLDLD